MRQILSEFSTVHKNQSLRTDFQVEDAKVLVIDWSEKSHDGMKIHQKLPARLDRPCPAYSTTIG
jgi:hypothetical protein